MLRRENIRRGLKRLVLVLLPAIAGAAVLYVIADSLILTRRKHLFTIEIISYIVIANIISFLAIIFSYRAARWIIRGFKAAGSDPRTPNRRSK